MHFNYTHYTAFDINILCMATDLFNEKYLDRNICIEFVRHWFSRNAIRFWGYCRTCVKLILFSGN